MSSRVAFFGATGGCAGYALANTLNAGYKCTALARTPAKLVSTIREKGVTSDTIDKHLTIVEGDVRDVNAVKQTLSLGDDSRRVVDKIVNGIGGTELGLQWSLHHPVYLKDKTVCQDAINAILEALAQLKALNKPSLFTISTTGIPPRSKPRDVPILFSGPYTWLLQDPHADKEVMQETLAKHMQLPRDQQLLDTYLLVKASLLLDGPSHGLEKVREGIDEKPAVGYTIRRADVGKWIFVKLVKAGPVKESWRGKGVTVTY